MNGNAMVSGRCAISLRSRRATRSGASTKDKYSAQLTKPPTTNAFDAAMNANVTSMLDPSGHQPAAEIPAIAARKASVTLGSLL